MPKPYKAPEIWHFFAGMAIVGFMLIGIASGILGFGELLRTLTWAVTP